MFQFAVIPGAAERRPRIQSADETLWIPAFAGMTKKNSTIKIQAFENAYCVMCVQRPALEKGDRGDLSLFKIPLGYLSRHFHWEGSGRSKNRLKIRRHGNQNWPVIYPNLSQRNPKEL